MSTEIELKLSLPTKSVGHLLRHPLLKSLPSKKQRLLNTYYDTPKLRLHAQQTALRFRKKGWDWLLTVKTAEPARGGLAMRNEWETAATPGNFDFSHVDRSDLREFLERLAPKLRPVFTTDFKRQAWHVPFGESLIELALDRGRIESGKKKAAISEVELELISGQVRDIFGLARALQEEVDLRPAIASKAERGYALFTGALKTPFHAKATALAAEQTPVEAFRLIALNCLEHFQRNEAGLLLSDDPEFVHQARVAMRRLRSAIKVFTPALPPDFVEIYGQTWQALSSALGEARNWDVLLTETLPTVHLAFPENQEIRRLQRDGTRAARRARQTIRAMLNLREYQRLMTEFTAALFALHDVMPTPLDIFATATLDDQIARASDLARQFSPVDAEGQHRLRIRFKRLRYTLEFFAPLFPRKKLQAYHCKLARLQDQLGLLNDHVTARGLLTRHHLKGEGGVVHGWISGRYQLLLDALPAALEDWSSQPPPWH